MIGGDGINDESNKTAPAPDNEAPMIKDCVLTNCQIRLKSVFHLGSPVQTRPNNLMRILREKTVSIVDGHVLNNSL